MTNMYFVKEKDLVWFSEISKKMLLDLWLIYLLYHKLDLSYHSQVKVFPSYF